MAGQFVPAKGSGCDTGLRNENDSQTAEDSGHEQIREKDHGVSGSGRFQRWRFFVKKFAVPENTRESAAFCQGRRDIQAVGGMNPGGPVTVSRTGIELARMLLTQTIAMTTRALSMRMRGRAIKAVPRQPVAKPRELSHAPSFFCLGFLCESFHQSVGTHSRPLRGGKDGSVCRVM